LTPTTAAYRDPAGVTDHGWTCEEIGPLLD
jgi:hypothetical protein